MFWLVGGPLGVESGHVRTSVPAAAGGGRDGGTRTDRARLGRAARSGPRAHPELGGRRVGRRVGRRGAGVLDPHRPVHPGQAGAGRGDRTGGDPAIGRRLPGCGARVGVPTPGIPGPGRAGPPGSRGRRRRAGRVAPPAGVARAGGSGRSTGGGDGDLGRGAAPADPGAAADRTGAGDGRGAAEPALRRGRSRRGRASSEPSARAGRAGSGRRTGGRGGDPPPRAGRGRVVRAYRRRGTNCAGRARAEYSTAQEQADRAQLALAATPGLRRCAVGPPATVGWSCC